MIYHYELFVDTSSEPPRITVILKSDSIKLKDVNITKDDINIYMGESQKFLSAKSDKLPATRLSDKKNRHLEFVWLTDNEYNKLIEKFGKEEADQKIQELNDGIGCKGYKYSSHYFAIMSWDRRKKSTIKTKESYAELEEKRREAIRRESILKATADSGQSAD